MEVQEEESDQETGQPGAAAAAVRQAEAEGLTLQPSDNSAGYRGVYKDCLVGSCTKPFLARVSRAGTLVRLGRFDTAEEAALAFARANARTDARAAAPRPAAAKRAAPPPPKPPSAKQPRHTPPLRPVQPVPPPPRDSTAAQASTKIEAVSPAVAAPAVAAAAVAAPAVAAPAQMIFKDKLALLKRELEIALETPAIPAVAEANQLMGITPGLGESLGVQLDRLLAIIAS